MKCPFCGSKMMIIHKPTGTKYMCVSKGPLLTKEKPICPYAGDELTRTQIDQIVVALIDAEME
jgi:hypothetical protein